MSESNRAQEMIQYLLGTLPESETERFDALSVGDTEFADELGAMEKNLVDAYVEGDLTGETLARFESYYLASPIRREKVEFARAFQVYAERDWTSTSSDRARDSSKSPRPTAGILAAPRAWNPSLILRWSAAAAAVVLIAAGGWWALQNRAPGESVVATFVLAPPLRGSDQVPTLAIPSTSGAVEIRLELESVDYPAYRVALSEESELWQSETMEAVSTNESHYLKVRFPARLLQAQTYSLVVSGVPAQGESEVIGNYPFRAQIK